jgi:competence protein ComEC
MSGLDREWIPTFLVAGLVAILAAVWLILSKKRYEPILIVAFFFLGAANLAFHLEESSPGHLIPFIEQGAADYGSVIEGYVSNAPEIRERYTVVPFRVTRIQSPAGTEHTVRKGKLYLKVYTSSGIPVSTIGYGDQIRLSEVNIRQPAGEMNPGGFNMRSFLRNQEYFGMVSVRRLDQLTVIDHNLRNPFLASALTVKRHLLTSIKRTMPYPESSFLGGVLLGLRSGLSYDVKDTFRAAGVSHVLAVSGLHVTIITLFFMGLFQLLRLPRTTAAILIIAALVIFTLITGARPSTIRAAIMNSVTLFFFYFKGVKLDRSLLLGLAMAALILLTLNPLILGEASFLFSFSAVLSLALLTRPIWILACKYLTGFFRIFLAAFLLLGFCVFIAAPEAFVQNWQYTLSAFILLLAAWIVDRSTTWSVEFRQLPNWVSVFVAAQVSIQLGMLPLTALYFKKISLTAGLANFLAIPLIGVIVQLGLFACLLDQIPVLGIYPAIALNAANWLAIKLFMGSARFFGTQFPYPDISPPDPEFLLPYYTCLLLVAFHPWIRWNILPKIRTIWQHRRLTGFRIRLVAAACLIGILLASVTVTYISKPPELLICFFDPSMFYMGGGSSVFVRTPDGYTLLADAGPRRTMFSGHEISLEIGAKVIVPALLQLNCKHLDSALLSSPQSNRAGGLISVLRNRSIRIDTFHHPLPFQRIQPEESDLDILHKFNDPVLFGKHNLDESQMLAWDLKDCLLFAELRDIPCIPLHENLLLHRETVHRDNTEFPLTIRALSPPSTRFDGRYSTTSNSAAIEIEFGKHRFLLCSEIDRRAQKYLLDSGVRPVTLLQIPSGGAPYSYEEAFVEALSPHIAVTSPSRNQWKLKAASQTYQAYESKGIPVFRTDRDGAVTVRSNGQSLHVEGMCSDSKLEMDS